MQWYFKVWRLCFKHKKHRNIYSIFYQPLTNIFVSRSLIELKHGRIAAPDSANKAETWQELLPLRVQIKFLRIGETSLRIVFFFLLKTSFQQASQPIKTNTVLFIL